MTQKLEGPDLNRFCLGAHHKNIRNFYCRVTESFLMFSSAYDVIVIKFQIKHGSNSPLMFFSKMGTGYQIGQISAVFSRNRFISQKDSIFQCFLCLFAISSQVIGYLSLWDNESKNSLRRIVPKDRKTLTGSLLNILSKFRVRKINCSF